MSKRLDMTSMQCIEYKKEIFIAPKSVDMNSDLPDKPDSKWIKLTLVADDFYIFTDPQGNTHTVFIPTQCANNSVAVYKSKDGSMKYIRNGFDKFSHQKCNVVI